MTQHLITTEMQLANCDKCNAFVWMSEVSGIRTIVDPQRLDGMEDVRRRLMMGRTVYRVLPGRKLAIFGRLSTKSEADTYLADHWCTAGTTGARAVPRDETPRPPSAPVTPSRVFDPPTAPGSGSQGHAALPIMTPVCSAPRSSHATRATPRPTRCDICNELIRHDTPDVWSVEYDGRLVYARHDSC